MCKKVKFTKLKSIATVEYVNIQKFFKEGGEELFTLNKSELEWLLVKLVMMNTDYKVDRFIDILSYRLEVKREFNRYLFNSILSFSAIVVAICAISFK